MSEKYYAVKVGMETGIFTSWEACRARVSGYSGAVYKSFPTREQACAYLGMEAEDEKSRHDFVQKDGMNERDCVKIYVDGSYHSVTGEFSYGMVVLSGDGEETYSHKFNDESLSSMRNVAGEIKGAEAAMQYAMDHELSEIEIYHDYEGIARWCLGEWKTNKEGTKAYKAFFDKASRQVKIRFVKVTGHSNDKYNDMADQLAKEALGLA